jgi:hypothetical protein
MTRAEVDSYFAELMNDQRFREAIFSYLEHFDQDNYRNFKKEAITDGDRAYFQGSGRACDSIRKYFETVMSIQKTIAEQKKQIEEDID